ncbi:MAG: NAD-dependent epimerase/dehydratase family protein [Myxococcaceae bacterium]|nr:NAD-dependent epimerase/dehydratase family protein [Myxococcaceae bacterium]
MRVLLTGATGMIGQGVLRECLNAEDVSEVVAVGRTPLGQTHPKLKELVRTNLLDWSDAGEVLRGVDACFYCLGVSSGGMSEADYTRVTVDLTLALATALKAASPEVTFVFISGASTDASEKGSVMWARVKGRAENALKAMGFRKLFLFRPGYIQPMDGITSKTTSYRWMYAVLAPTYPLLKRLFPRMVTSTRQVGRAMLNVTRGGFSKDTLESDDINLAAG